MSPVALILAATGAHAAAGIVSLLVVARYERRSHEAQDRRRAAFLDRLEPGR